MVSTDRFGLLKIFGGGSYYNIKIPQVESKYYYSSVTNVDLTCFFIYNYYITTKKNDIMSR